MFKIFSIGDHKNPPKPKTCKHENELNMKVGKKHRFTTNFPNGKK
jgi:hypothetical protein